MPRATSWLVVCVSYVNFASFHAAREAYMACKPALKRLGGYDERLLGVVDFFFCVSYAVGLAASGLVGRKFGARRTIATSFALTAATAAGFGFVGVGRGGGGTAADAWAGAARWHIPLWIASGLVQSMAYPNFVALLSRVIEDGRRGSVMTVWVTASPAGDVAGLAIASFVLGRFGEARWEYVMFASAGFVLINLALFLLFVRDAEEGREGESTALLEGDERASGASFAEVSADVWKIPGVLDYCFSIMALKVVVTSMLFWTPYYVDDRYDSSGWSIASTQMFDVSIIIGIGLTAVLNRLTDRWVTIFMVSLLLGVAPLTYLSYAKDVGGANACIFATGLLVGPAAALFASTMSAELGARAKQYTRHVGIVGVISGFIDSAGALGSGVGQILVGHVKSEYGWHTVFDMLAGFVVLGACCLVRLVRVEHKEKSSSWDRVAKSLVV